MWSQSISFVNLAGLTALNCKKTKGTYTNKDGKYRFPVERLDSLSPHDVTAIKPGYYGNERAVPTIKQQRAQSVDTYSNRDIYLVKQSAERPELRFFGDAQERCTHAESRDEIEASIQFLKIKKAEVERLGGESWRIRDIGQDISLLESRASTTK